MSAIISDNKVGRPLKFKTSKELEKAIAGYFAECEKSSKPLTISGLAVALGINRQTLLNYSKIEEFFGTIKKAKAICEKYTEESLFIGRNVAGAIFNLKNNYGWKDKSESDVNLTASLSLRSLFKEAEKQKDET